MRKREWEAAAENRLTFAHHILVVVCAYRFRGMTIQSRM